MEQKKHTPGPLTGYCFVTVVMALPENGHIVLIFSH